jgi:hypothetical protein
MRRLALIGALAAVGCGPAPAGIELTSLGTVQVLPCVLEPQDAVPEVSEGGWFEIPMKTVDEAVVTPTADVAAHWRAAVLQNPLRLRGNAFYGVSGKQELGVEVSCRGKTTAQTVALQIRPIHWDAPITWAAADGPSGREHPLMWIDPATPDKLWLYGGFTFVPKQYTVSSDFWSFDLAEKKWTQQTPAGAPARAGGRLALGSKAGEAWVLGGEDPSQAVDYTLNKLTVATPQFAPEASDPNGPKVTLGSLVYDAPRDRLISACGFTGTTIHCEVRARATTAGAKWEAIPMSGGLEPSARYGFFHTYDPLHHRLVIFGGAGFPTGTDPINAAQDTWALELDASPAKWVKLVDPVPTVPGRRNGCAALDTEQTGCMPCRACTCSTSTEGRKAG